MIPHLNPDGYAQTRAKLENLERRLASLKSRTDLEPSLIAEVRRSYMTMMRKYRREVMLFEAEQSRQTGSH
jgi:hypothetical protein